MFVAVLSDKPELRENYCKSFGKEVLKDELGIYSANFNGKRIWLIDPLAYPDRIQPLLHTLSMADFIVLIADSLTPKIGELFVAVNSLKLESGVIVSPVQLPVTGMVVEKYDKVTDNKNAMEKILAASVNAGENQFGLVYKTANMQSIGHVAYGTLKGGKLKKQDKLFLLPEKKEIEVRSIHVDGTNVDEIVATSGFEMAYKGDLIEKGILAPLRNDYQVENIVNGRFIKNPFYKDELKGKIHAYTNMQYVEGHITDNDLTLSAPLAFEKGELILVIDASNQKLRIAGVFQSKW